MAPSDSGSSCPTGKVPTSPTGPATSTSERDDHDFGPSGRLGPDQMVGATTQDAAVFESEFVPEGEHATMQSPSRRRSISNTSTAASTTPWASWVNGEKAKLDRRRRRHHHRQHQRYVEFEPLHRQPVVRRCAQHRNGWRDRATDAQGAGQARARSTPSRLRSPTTVTAPMTAT